MIDKELRKWAIDMAVHVWWRNDINDILERAAKIEQWIKTDSMNDTSNSLSGVNEPTSTENKLHDHNKLTVEDWHNNLNKLHDLEQMRKKWEKIFIDVLSNIPVSPKLKVKKQ